MQPTTLGGLFLRQTRRAAPINQHSWGICGRLGGRFMMAGYWRASIRLCRKGQRLLGVGAQGRHWEGWGWRRGWKEAFVIKDQKRKMREESCIHSPTGVFGCDESQMRCEVPRSSVQGDGWGEGCGRVKRRCQVVTGSHELRLAVICE